MGQGRLHVVRDEARKGDAISRRGDQGGGAGRELPGDLDGDVGGDGEVAPKGLHGLREIDEGQPHRPVEDVRPHPLFEIGDEDDPSPGGEGAVDGGQGLRGLVEVDVVGVAAGGDDGGVALPLRPEGLELDGPFHALPPGPDGVAGHIVVGPALPVGNDVEEKGPPSLEKKIEIFGHVLVDGIPLEDARGDAGVESPVGHPQAVIGLDARPGADSGQEGLSSPGKAGQIVVADAADEDDEIGVGHLGLDGEDRSPRGLFAEIVRRRGVVTENGVVGTGERPDDAGHLLLRRGAVLSQSQDPLDLAASGPTEPLRDAFDHEGDLLPGPRRVGKDDGDPFGPLGEVFQGERAQRLVEGRRGGPGRSVDGVGRGMDEGQRRLPRQGRSSPGDCNGLFHVRVPSFRPPSRGGLVDQQSQRAKGARRKTERTARTK